MASAARVITRLAVLHAALDRCTICPKMVRPTVHGPAIATRILVVGQAPGPHEGAIGRPFAWTAGKTLFRWLAGPTGADENAIRERIYFAAVARCFPGKAKGGGDRKPDPQEILDCRPFLAGEMMILKPELVIPVGSLAIAEVLGHTGKLDAIIGQTKRATYHGVSVDVIPLPHPSGASTWHRMEPGLTLLGKALAALGRHPTILAAFGTTKPSP
ncbi:uracil-DNA glycosylase family protein [soil metagenome]